MYQVTERQVDLIKQFRSNYIKLREEHDAKSKHYDKYEMYAEYMAERTMAAYCRGVVFALDDVLRLIESGVVK